MGTNFYWTPEAGRMLGIDEEIFNPDADWGVRNNAEVHIGKRSAAGRYCWDCRTTLHRRGEDAIHFDSGGEESWFSACPECDKPWITPSLTESSAGLELGFARPRTEPPTGVASCSSFSWAQDPDRARAFCKANPEMEAVIDEYGERMTADSFLEMLRGNCPIEYRRMIGQAFC
jgi:hypothetical protein